MYKNANISRLRSTNDHCAHVIIDHEPALFLLYSLRGNGPLIQDLGTDQHGLQRCMHLPLVEEVSRKGRVEGNH